ncbi:PucR family transcriptional regulator [Bacillus salitolerans]|uniref:PucR family transcriptional regulator n=1 Tax=Bacillus salitolerans TaxID=1437434 RepID=A0ABW4LX10_9BACI
MIEKLKEKFPALIIQQTIPSNEEHEWFLYREDVYIGIPKHELTHRDKSMLSIFLTPFQTGEHLSVEQALWHQLISNKPEAVHKFNHVYKEKKMFRFIHFYLHDEVEMSSFEEAVTSLLVSDLIFLWLHPKGGLLIERDNLEYDFHEDFMNLRNVIIADFYTDLDLYVGTFFTHDDVIHEVFSWEKHCFELARRHSNRKGIFYFYEVVPFLVLSETSDTLRQQLSTIIKADFSQEEIKSIKVFIECGLNISLAAKQLFMHRNSMQYRVDKFIEKTGIDIKAFQGAFVMYLAILNHDY